MKLVLAFFSGTLMTITAAATAASGSNLMIYPKSGWGQARGNFPGANTMSQRDVAFQPGTLIVTKGSTVRFPNEDRVRHSVYSFSKAAKFQIKLYGRDQTKTKNFPVAGSVALGCNIHDQMKGYIVVVDTPFAAKTDHNGLLSIRNLPFGAATMKVWHPANRVRGGESASTISLGSGANRQNVKLSLR